MLKQSAIIILLVLFPSNVSAYGSQNRDPEQPTNRNGGHRDPYWPNQQGSQSNHQTHNENKSKSSSSGDKDSFWEDYGLYLVIGLGAIVLLLIISLLIVCCCLCKNRNAQNKDLEKQPPQPGVPTQAPYPASLSAGSATMTKTTEDPPPGPAQPMTYQGETPWKNGSSQSARSKTKNGQKEIARFQPDSMVHGSSWEDWRPVGSPPPAPPSSPSDRNTSPTVMPKPDTTQINQPLVHPTKAPIAASTSVPDPIPVPIVPLQTDEQCFGIEIDDNVQPTEQAEAQVVPPGVMSQPDIRSAPQPNAESDQNASDRSNGNGPEEMDQPPQWSMRDVPDSMSEYSSRGSGSRSQSSNSKSFKETGAMRRGASKRR